MTYPVAMIPYANMAPFQELGPPKGAEFINYLPRDSIKALKQKQVWAAAVPVGGLAALGDDVMPLGLYGIAVQDYSMSVLFFSDRPFDQFRRPLTIDLTGESASSVRLLYLLLGYQHGFDAIPYLAAQESPSNGYLVIGDRALQWAREFEGHGEVQGYRYVTDLSAQWYARFRLPFVFARWVVHKLAPETVKLDLEQWLQNFTAREPSLIRQVAPKVAARLNLSLDYVLRYLKVIRRCLSREDAAGQALFCEELNKYARQPLFLRSKTATDKAVAQDRM